ncbi:hypothetical protein VPH35_026306 [Triticum aestivum]
MRAACKLASRVLNFAGTFFFRENAKSFAFHCIEEKGFYNPPRRLGLQKTPSITTNEIDRAVHHMIVEAGAYPSPLGYGGFPKNIINIDVNVFLNYFLWRKKAEYAISAHYDHTCVWEEVLQNKCLNKYNHTAIDGQFYFYQSEGL